MKRICRPAKTFAGYSLVFLLSLSISACSSIPPQQNGTTAVTPTWVIVESVGSFDFSRRVKGHGKMREFGLAPPPQSIEIAYLVKQPGGVWVAKVEGNASQLGVEAIALDTKRKRVGLAATAPEVFQNEIGNICEMNADGKRSQSGYLLCNSAFTKPEFNLGTLVFSPINKLAGQNIQTLKIDKEKFKEAISQINLDKLSELLEFRNANLNRRKQLAAQQALSQEVARDAEFQRNLVAGVHSHCGLVVEVRETVVLVQPIGANAVWLAKNRIKPPQKMSMSQLLAECN